jgi:putative restriction endonuclease
LLNPHAFGGANLHRLPSEARSLATVLKRPVGSLTNKMLNLEGFRADGARVETELFLHLGRNADRFAVLYQMVIQAARVEGFGEPGVPDFLGWLDLAPEPHLIGQDEIGSRELDLALVGASDDLRAMEQAYGFDEVETSRIVEQRVRLRQHCFAHRVLTQYRHRCAFCGLDASGLRGHRLLVASHVKPWAVATNRERLDPRNGVAACTIHDSAFDTGLLTIQRDLTILRATALERILRPSTAGQPVTTTGSPPSSADTASDSMLRAASAATHLFGPGILADRLLVSADISGPAPAYLDYHRHAIFCG